MIEALAADGADDPFHERVLPGCFGSDDHFANSHVSGSPGEALAVDGIPVAEPDIAERSRSGRSRDLAGGPDCRRMFRDVQVEEFAAIMSKDDEDEEQAKREGGDEEEVDGHDILGMGGEKARHVGDGRGDVRCMYLATVSSATA